ncbi:MAG: hypothetical protein ACLT98_13490 [Eggerthellaceae bacterium]
MAFLYCRFAARCSSGRIELRDRSWGCSRRITAFACRALCRPARHLHPLMMNTVLAVAKNKLGTYMSIGSCTITFARIRARSLRRHRDRLRMA